MTMDRPYTATAVHTQALEDVAANPSTRSGHLVRSRPTDARRMLVGGASWIALATCWLGAGCGSSAERPSNAASTATPAGQHSQIAPTPSRSRTPGGDAHSDAHGNASLARHFAPATGKRRVLLAASSGCAFAHIGAPAAPLHSAKPDAWRRYAAAARPFALRTAASLQKVPAGRLQIPELQRLVADFNHLAQVYASDGSNRHLVQIIAASEQRTAADALVARVPACAPPTSLPASTTKR